MALVAYSMAGEGRGHATRVRAMVEMERFRSAHLVAFESRLRELRARCLQVAPNGNAFALAAVLHHLPSRSAPALCRAVAPTPTPLRPTTLGGHS